jgi:hypothetical protein
MGQRPGTARAAPPRIKRREMGEAPASMLPKADGQGMETSNIISIGDAENTKKDDADDFVVEANHDDFALMAPMLGNLFILILINISHTYR